MRRLVAAGLLPERAGQPVKAWVHISLADLMMLDGSSALLEEWTARVRARCAGHRAAASAGGSDGGAWLDGDAAQAVACDAAMAPFVTGEVNPAALEDWSGCASSSTGSITTLAPAATPAEPPPAGRAPPARIPRGPGRPLSGPSSAKPRIFYCTHDQCLTCGNPQVRRTCGQQRVATPSTTCDHRTGGASSRADTSGQETGCHLHLARGPLRLS